MKKNKLFIFVFVFIMFFGINMDGVLALNERGGGGDVTSYSYGIVCVYGGQRKWTTSKTTSSGGGNLDQNYPFTYTLKVNCSDKDCKDLSVSTYGLVKNQDGANKKIKINNKDKLNYMVNHNKDKFGFVEGEGVSTCPNKVGFEWETLKSYTLDKVDEFGNFLLNSGSNNQGSLESTQKFFISNANDIDIKSETVSSISGKKRTTTDNYGTDETSTTKEIENKRQHGSNKDLIPYIMKAYSHLGNEDYGISNDGTITCSALLGPDNIKLIHDILLFMCILGIIMVVVFGIMEFIKAISSSDDDALAKAFKRLKVRLISIIILLILPVFVNLVLGLINDNVHFEIVKNVNGVEKVTEDVSIQIGKASDCN